MKKEQAVVPRGAAACSFASVGVQKRWAIRGDTASSEAIQARIYGQKFKDRIDIIRDILYSEDDVISSLIPALQLSVWLHSDPVWKHGYIRKFLYSW